MLSITMKMKRFIYLFMTSTKQQFLTICFINFLQSHLIQVMQNFLRSHACSFYQKFRSHFRAVQRQTTLWSPFLIYVFIFTGFLLTYLEHLWFGRFWLHVVLQNDVCLILLHSGLTTYLSLKKNTVLLDYCQFTAQISEKTKLLLQLPHQTHTCQKIKMENKIKNSLLLSKLRSTAFCYMHIISKTITKLQHYRWDVTNKSG